MPTIMEAVVLWILICGVAAFLGLQDLVIGINILIVLMIGAGFFIGIGIKILNAFI